MAQGSNTGINVDVQSGHVLRHHGHRLPSPWIMYNARHKMHGTCKVFGLFDIRLRCHGLNEIVLPDIFTVYRHVFHIAKSREGHCELLDAAGRRGCCNQSTGVSCERHGNKLQVSRQEHWGMINDVHHECRRHLHENKPEVLVPACLCTSEDPGNVSYDQRGS